MIPILLCLSIAAPLPPRPACPPEPVRVMPQCCDDRPWLPPLSDVVRFPDRAEAIAAVAWADRHLEWLEAQQALDLVYPEFWLAWIVDAKAAVAPWRLLEAIHRPPLLMESDRDRLDAIRDLIGEDAYRAGRIPPPVPPLWRFRNMP